MIKFGAALATTIELPVHTLRRSAADIHRDGYRKLTVYRLISGAAEFTHPGGKAAILPGQCIMVDHGTPHERHFSEPSHMLGLHMSKAFVASLLPYPENAAFRPIPVEGWGGVLSCAMGMLTPSALQTSAVCPNVIAGQIVSLLGLARPLVREPMKSGRLSILNRLRQIMGARLHEAELTPDSVAANEGISKRTLHALFAENGTSFGAELMSLRLASAQRLLEDSRFSRHSIAEIAGLCGFANSSHFGRRFREKFGISPAVYRSLLPTPEDQAV